MAKRKNMIVLDSSLRGVERWSKRPTRNERRRRIYLGAALAIASVLVLLAIIDGIGSMYATIVRSGGSGEVTVEKTFGQNDALNVLVVKVNDNASELVNAVLVRFDPARGCSVCIPLSAQTVIGERTLSQSYALGGGAQCALDFGEMLGLEQVYYNVMTYSSIHDLVSEFRGVVLEIPCDIDYRGDRNIIVAAGRRKFSGGEAARLLDCPEWPDGVMQQTLMHAQLLCGLINENMTPSNASKLDICYSRANGSMMSSNVSLSTFQSYASGLTYLARLNTGSDVCVVYEPQYVVSGGVYELSAVTHADFEELFGMDGDGKENGNEN